MPYEIDFFGTDKVEKDYDAIAFRYFSNIEKRWIVCVFDGGTLDVGEEMCEHLKQYYLKDSDVIDYIFCSHPDLDHAAGLKPILEKNNVCNLVVNFPWCFADYLFDMVRDGRITKESLRRTLREKYPFVGEIEEMALQKKCNVIPGIVGVDLMPEMTILSPSLHFYLQCLAKSEKTPAIDGFNKIMKLLTPKTTSRNIMCATWGQDAIREGETTTPENESSIVLRVKTDEDEPFLLLGDVGCEGLRYAMDLADQLKIPLKECSFIQMPHHGGRHNVSPSILDRLIGKKVSEDIPTSKISFVSVGKNSDHPKKSVVNAFINRGCKVFVSKSNPIRHGSPGMLRKDWVSANPEIFSSTVEPWDD